MKLKKFISVLLAGAIWAGLFTALPASAAGVTGADIQAGAAIQFDRGAVALTTDIPDLETAVSQIRLTNADGTPVRGGYYIRQVADGEYDVVFGDLADGGKYQIICGDYSLPFSAKGLILNEDFEGYQPGDDLYGNYKNAAEGLKLLDTGSVPPTVTIEEDSIGNKFLNISAAPEQKDGTTDYNLYVNDFGTVTNDQLLITGKWRYYGPDGTTGARRGCVFSRLGETKLPNTRSNDYVTVASAVSDTENRIEVNGIGSNKPLIDKDTFYDYRLLYKPEGGTFFLGIRVGDNQVTNSTGGNKSGNNGNPVAQVESILLGHTYVRQIDGQQASLAVDDLRVEKLTAPRVLYTSAVYENNQIPAAAGSLDVYFSNDIDETALDGIRLLNSAGTAEKTGVAYDPDARRATLTYPALTGSADYTLELDGILSSRGVSMPKTEISISTQEDSAFNAACVYPTENGVVPYDMGAVSLQFNRQVDSGTVSEYISLTKADGSPIKGTYQVEPGADTQSLLVRFGELEYNTEYSLRTLEGFTDVNGEPLLPKEFTFTAEDMIADIDFGNLGIQGNPAAALKAGVKVGKGTLKLYDTSTASPSYTIGHGAADGSYLDIKSTPPEQKNTNIELYVEEFGGISSGKVLVSGKWNYYNADQDQATVGAARGRKMSRLYGADGTAKDYISVDEPGTVSATRHTASQKTQITPNTFYDYRLLYEKIDGDFALTAGLAGEEPFAVQNLGEQKTVDEISKILVGHMYGLGLNSVAGGATITQRQWGSLALGGIQIKKVNPPAVLAASVQDGAADVPPAMGSLEVYYTADLDPAQIGNITILDESGNNAACETVYDPASRKLTVSYNSLEDLANYRAMIPAQVSEDGITGEASEIAFTTTGVMKFRCVGNSLPGAVDIDTAIGAVVLTFNDFVDDATIGGITLKDNMGNPAPNYAVAAEGKTCKLTFSTLEPGKNYVIDIPASVKSADGLPAVATAINFRTKSPYFVDMDFENYTVEQDTHPDLGEPVIFTSAGVAGSADNMYVKSEEGNQFLRIYGDTKVDNIVSVPVDVSGGKTVSISMRARIGASDGSLGTAPRQLGKMFNGGASCEVMKFNNDGSIGTNANGRVVQNGTADWSSIKAVYTPDASGLYRVDLYHDDVYKTTVQSNLDNITSIMLGHIYNNTGLAAWTELDDIKVRYVNAPAVVNTNLAGNIMPIDGTQLTLYFSVPMDESTVTNSNITVKQGETVLDAAGTYDPKANAYTIVFYDYFTPDAEYTVEFANVQSKDRIALTAPYTFRAGSMNISVSGAFISAEKGGEPAVSAAGLETAYANAVLKNNMGNEEKAFVILAAYDAQGRVVKLNSRGYTLSSGNEKRVSDLFIDGLKAAQASEIRLYVWDGVSTMCPLLTAPVTIK